MYIWHYFNRTFDKNFCSNNKQIKIAEYNENKLLFNSNNIKVLV